MKKIEILFLTILVLIFVIVGGYKVYSTGTNDVSHVTQTVYSLPNGFYVMDLAVIADTTGAVSNYTTTKTIDGFVYMIETIPGSPTPSSYSLTLLDSNSYDISTPGGGLASRSTSATQIIYPYLPVQGTLTLTASGVSTHLGQFKVRIFYYR